MRKYSYATNSYYKTASLVIEDASWYIFVLENIIERICSAMPNIPFPPIKMKLSKENKDFLGTEEKYTTLKEWYGDISSWFCCTVHNPVLNFCSKYILTRMIKLDYEELKKATKSDLHWSREIEYSKDDEDEEKD